MAPYNPSDYLSEYHIYSNIWFVLPSILLYVNERVLWSMNFYFLLILKDSQKLLSSHGVRREGKWAVLIRDF